MTETLNTRMNRVAAHRALLDARAEQRIVDAAIAQATERIVEAFARPSN